VKGGSTDDANLLADDVNLLAQIPNFSASRPPSLSQTHWSASRHMRGLILMAVLQYWHTLAPDRLVFSIQSRSVISFEEFLNRARTSGITDPGTAMMSVLRVNHVPGVNVGRIERDLTLNPSGNPGNVLRFLCTIAREGQWGVNLNVTVR